MKISLFIVVLCATLLCSFPVFGQSADDINLSELKTPSSPAFTILGVQPTDISRPKSYQALEASLFNSLGGGGGSFVFPNSYALEFSPFWLPNHPDLTFENYVDPNVPNAALQNLSISIATTQLKNADDPSVTENKIGFGLRTMLLSGSLPNEVKILATGIRAKQELLLDAISIFQFIILNDDSIKTTNDLVSKTQAEFNSRKVAMQPTNSDRSQEIIDNFIIPFLEQSKAATHEELVNVINHELIKKAGEFESTNEINVAAQDLSETNKDYYGFMLEVATGMVLDFPTGTFNYSRIPKYGLWLTPTYRTEDRNFEVSVLLRMITITPHDSTPNFQLSSSVGDVGGQITFQKDKFSLSGEMVGRFASTTTTDKVLNSDVKTNSTDLKGVLHVSYKLSDKIILSYAFGKSLPSPGEQLKANLISLLSFNFGFGAPTAATIK